MRILLMLIISFIFGVTAYVLYPLDLTIAVGFGIMAILFFYSAFRPIGPPPTLPEFCLYLGVFGGGMLILNVVFGVDLFSFFEWLDSLTVK